ncbi:nitrogen permease regulator 3 protein [Echinococcus multilocularis]|uniref:GATOR complex protein NPRL3 n=1 Tax=Echinococcus multilocularis TaxID=6211 RepID=A0A087W2H5_ECHMU|nr:nitrogen permease regulator 3 protein [Echinococcus multilocularis]
MFWNEEEIVPRSLLLISSGAVGDRLLFWKSTSAPGSSVQQEQVPSRIADTRRQKFPTSLETPPFHCTQSLNSSQYGHRGVSCPSPAGVCVGGHLTTSASSVVVGSPQQAVIPSGEVTISSALGAGKTRLSGAPPSAQRHSTAAVTAVTSSGNSGASGNLNQSGGSIAVAPTEMIVEDVPVSSLLSLLHPSTNELQHKIHIKLSTKVFVGVAFSLAKSIMETNGVPVINQSSSLTNRRGSMPSTSTCATVAPKPPMDFTSIINFLRLKSPLPPPKCESSQTQVAHCGGLFGAISSKKGEKTINQNVSSFAVVFVLNEATPPSIQSHYTELARLTGAQIRRSELYWQNLSSEREKISAILDRYAGILSNGDGQVDAGEHSGSNGSSVDDNGNISVTNESVGGTEVVSPLITTHKMAPSEAPEEDDSAKFNKHEFTGGGRCDPWWVYAHVAKRSSLCSELSQILSQVSSSGRVNVKIYNKYSVFFCLPFKAYAIMPFGLKMVTTPKPCWPAIRPGAVWRAMQRLQPYHTLLLTTRKRFLHVYTDSFPTDVNQSLESFVEDISPISSLVSMSNRGHSQEDCLRVALWLVYHGHAIIISPIASSNAYTLAPLSHYWLQPKVLLQFAAQFPKLNFAEVLSSFSDYYTLEDHFNGQSPSQFWTKLSATEGADLVAWLLRRRLIVQIHIYLLSLLQRKNNDVPLDHDKGTSDSNSSSSLSGPSESAFLRIHQGCGGALLQSALPNEVDRERVLVHYRSAVQHYPNMLHLFLRLLTHLPAHLEELMFVESVDRQTLISCMQLFSPFLITMRLPDPVTACFAGVEWSH